MHQSVYYSSKSSVDLKVQHLHQQEFCLGHGSMKSSPAEATRERKKENYSATRRPAPAPLGAGAPTPPQDLVRSFVSAIDARLC